MWTRKENYEHGSVGKINVVFVNTYDMSRRTEVNEEMKWIQGSAIFPVFCVDPDCALIQAPRGGKNTTMFTSGIFSNS